NTYLEADERRVAPALYRCIHAIAVALGDGERDYRRLETDGWRELEAAGMRPDYLSVRRRDDLEEPLPDLPAEQLVVLAAAHLGRARLIDNLPVDLPPAG
ncbi:MAG: pantoate--beta-alanine ligase, partial [Ectothiorhodospira sp.]